MQRFIDPDTGEYVDLHDPNRYSARKRSVFGRRWCKMCVHMNSELAMLPLTKTDFKVWHGLICGLHLGNRIEISQATVAKICRLTPASVSRSVNHLSRMDLVRKLGPSSYRINPLYVWRGENAGHADAVQAWQSQTIQ